MENILLCMYTPHFYNTLQCILQYTHQSHTLTNVDSVAVTVKLGFLFRVINYFTSSGDTSYSGIAWLCGNSILLCLGISILIMYPIFLPDDVNSPMIAACSE